MLSRILRSYLNFLLGDDKTDKDELGLVIFFNLLTGILMWSYAFQSYLFLENILLLKYMGMTYALLHIISPFFYKLTRSVVFCSYSFIIFGFMFQFHHALATGGIFSSTCIWFSILPLLIGFLTSTFHLIIWFFITSLSIILLYIITLNGLPTFEVSEVVKTWSQLNIAFGYILLNCSIFYLYSKFRIKHERDLEGKTINIRNLVRVLCHDISNPLTVMKLSLNKISREKFSIIEQERLNSISNSAETITEIIQSVKNLDLINEGKRKLTYEKIDLTSSLLKSINSFQALMLEKEIGVNIQFDILKKIPIKGNASILQNQVFNNILSNAIKFSKRNTIIDINLDSGDKSIYVIFQDYGIGIPESKLNSIFDPVSKTSTLGTEGESGTGFGMPIIKDILEQFGATVSIRSKDEQNYPSDHGTEVILQFPKVI